MVIVLMRVRVSADVVALDSHVPVMVVVERRAWSMREVILHREGPLTVFEVEALTLAVLARRGLARCVDGSVHGSVYAGVG